MKKRTMRSLTALVVVGATTLGLTTYAMGRSSNPTAANRQK